MYIYKLLVWLIVACESEWLSLALVSNPRLWALATSTRSTRLEAVSSSRVAVLDGGEWTLVQSVLPKQPALTPQSYKAGYMTVITGTIEGQEVQSGRVMGIQAINEEENDNIVSLGDGIHVYKDSIVSIPPNVNDEDAISTLAASLSGVYCGLPRVDDVGGGGIGESFVSGKVVVMGGSDYACFVAEALATLGASVTIVTTNNKLKLQNEDIDVMSPAVGELEIGFASAMGKFDSLVDTMSDERRISSFDDDADEDDIFGISRSGVISLLKSQHNCHRYVSTMTESQRIVRDDGVLFGRGKADKHVSTLQKELSSLKPTQGSSLLYQSIVPPKGFATMVETFLNNNVLFSAQQNNNVLVRKWTLQEFWELTSWPRDSSGTNVRFGLPVLDDFMEEDEEEMISEPPLTNVDANLREREKALLEEEEAQEAALGKPQPQKNPFVMDIPDLSILQQEVLTSPRDCVLFMSATYCQTCRYLTPAYTRMARMTTSSDDSIFFAKANTNGKSGKELGRALNVETVPTFVMFRGGKRYGTPLAVTKLPSKKLDLAVKYLTSGMEWDSTAFRDMD